MKRMIISMFAAVAAATTFADTVAWWHFDEAAPGSTTTSGVVTESVSDTTATPYSINASTTYASGSYLPVFARAFPGLAVYDPVSGATNANRSAMKFKTARGGSSPDGNSGRAYYGGALTLDGCDTLYKDCKNSITIEAFVCTTGGVYNTFSRHLLLLLSGTYVVLLSA